MSKLSIQYLHVYRISDMRQTHSILHIIIRSLSYHAILFLYSFSIFIISSYFSRSQIVLVNLHPFKVTFGRDSPEKSRSRILTKDELIPHREKSGNIIIEKKTWKISLQLECSFIFIVFVRFLTFAPVLWEVRNVTRNYLANDWLFYRSC